MPSDGIQAEIFPLLDHGFVRLVNYMGSDLDIIRAARNSFDAAWRAGDNEGSDERLMRYLMRNRHSTPFEVVSVQFEVKAPIFVFRQWHRHRTWTYNEVSARYTELPDEFYVPRTEHIGTQSKSNKQGRDLNGATETGRAFEIGAYELACNDAFKTYKTLLARGWPRELARAVLPVATYSKMFAKTNLWNLFNFLNLRLDSHAQYEIRVYAQAMLELTRQIVPVAVAAWEESRG